MWKILIFTIFIYFLGEIVIEDSDSMQKMFIGWVEWNILTNMMRIKCQSVGSLKGDKRADYLVTNYFC